MTFLQLLSTRAQQNVTYHCQKSIAYYDQVNKTYNKAAIFMTYNDLELVAQKPVKFKYSVTDDQCRVRYI